MHGLSAVIGPNLGAIILSLTGSWHWMFLINLPIALFLVIFGFLKIEETKPGTSKPMDIVGTIDRKSTRLNSSHVAISYAVFCLKKKKINNINIRTDLH